MRSKGNEKGWVDRMGDNEDEDQDVQWQVELSCLEDSGQWNFFHEDM